jgi:hypothetical protein
MALCSIQNYGNAFHIYYHVQCTYFLAEWLIITCWNKQTKQSTCPRMTVPTAVYHWQYLLQFVTDSIFYSLSVTVPSTVCHWQYLLQFVTDSIFYSLSPTLLITSGTFKWYEIHSQWHLEQNDAMWYALAWDVLGVWPSADNPTGSRERKMQTWCLPHASLKDADMMPATHNTEGCPILNCLFTTQIHRRDADCWQTTCNKSWQLPATFCISSVPVLPEPRELLWHTWVNSGQTSNLHKSRRLQCWHTWGGSEGVGSSFRLKEQYCVNVRKVIFTGADCALPVESVGSKLACVTVLALVAQLKGVTVLALVAQLKGVTSARDNFQV